jgi:hypothetical protein
MKFQAEMQAQKEVDANRQEWEARQKTLELQQHAQLEAQRQAFETEREQLRLGFERWRVEYTEQMKLQIAREGGQQDKEMAMAASLGKLADNLNRPKTIKRDEQGRATGIE